MAKVKKTQMEELTKNYETFIKGKQLKENGAKEFEKTIKKAVTPKPRDSK